MREIKFRAWDGEKMQQVTLLGLMYKHDGNPPVYIDMPGTDRVPRYSDVKLMQYAGLKDKNGVEIYEGDIVKDTHDYEDIYQVVYEHNGFWMKDRDANEYGSGFENEEWIEVIGNIHETPELLEAES